ncbi:MAG: septal ring lytic transglycosylase RlpA family protein [Desulfobulbus sp.]|nr:septal ring lytic transglycosylase RlpA family protein [Desulfobulbus sp.]
MRTSKLVFMVMIGLAILEFSCGQLLSAASTTEAGVPSVAVLHASSTPTVIALKPNISMKGKASFYADKFVGHRTASGQIFHQGQLTAAHRSLPIGTTVRVVNLRNKRSVEVKINDRGPWCNGRIIDLSKAAARKLGMMRSGVAMVQLEVIKQPYSGRS